MANDYSGAVSRTIYATAYADGMPEYLCRLIVAQAKHETGNYTSKFFKEDNNCFGYTYVKGSKYQISGGSLADNHQPIAKYASIDNSVHELTSWIKRRQNEKKFPSDLSEIDSPLKYASLLKAAGYFGDTLSHYVAGIQNFIASIA